MKQSDPQFKLRIPQDLKEQLEAAAKENSRSVTAEIIHRLQISLASDLLQIDDDPPMSQLDTLAAKVDRLGSLLDTALKSLESRRKKE